MSSTSLYIKCADEILLLRKMGTLHPWYTPSTAKEIEKASKLVTKLFSDNRSERSEIQNMSIAFENLGDNVDTEQLESFWKKYKHGQLDMKRVKIQSCQALLPILQYVRCDSLYLVNVRLSSDDCKLIVQHVLYNVKYLYFQNAKLEITKENEKEIQKNLSKHYQTKFNSDERMKCELIECLNNYENKGIIQSWQKVMNWKGIDNKRNKITIMKK